MKTERFKMAAKITILAAIIVCGFLINAAFAAQDPASTALLFTYYDTRSSAVCDGSTPDCSGLGLTDNYFTVTNTSTYWMQAHVRIRTGEKSVELLDFDVLLSPKDVFAFDLYQSQGGMEFASCDTHTLQNSGFPVNAAGCVIFNSGTDAGSFMLGLIEQCQGYDAPTALAATLKGYVEVIGEGLIAPNKLDKTKCASCGSTASVVAACTEVIPGRTIYDMLTATDGSACFLGTDIKNMTQVLEGKVYYATGENGDIVRLGTLNAEALNNYLPHFDTTVSGIVVDKRIIVHADDFASEQARCTSDLDGGCFAYGNPSTTALTNAAGDLNSCFYTDTAIPSGGGSAVGVYNKFGAAATFGPTLADLYDRRDGDLADTANNLDNLSFNFSRMYGNEDMFVGDGGKVPKDLAESHYLAYTLPGSPLDVNTKFAFIFPFQHFIKESDVLATPTAYDMEENTQTIPTTKFISPGLPTISHPGDEAALYGPSPWPYAEGWVSWRPTASNPTKTNCTVPGATPPDNETDCQVRYPLTGTIYRPGYTGAVFNFGTNELTASHLWYRKDKTLHED